MKLEITSITRDDLARLFEQLFDFYVIIPECHMFLTKGGQYDNYNIADVLIGGGSILVVDFQDPCLKEEINTFYGERHTNWESKSIYVDDDNTCYPQYEVTLSTIISGINNCKEDGIFDFIADFIGENEDYLCCYNILQAAIFGEIVYG